ncbi:hypothetical protein SDC9_83266 [bioreactor metagenome]|uniref:Uncharacterized protein n=1 Tax=bioreactor metagenome TaxID=1076179 RepID=A0A644Z7R3_9ZZZZ
MSTIRDAGERSEALGAEPQRADDLDRSHHDQRDAEQPPQRQRAVDRGEQQDDAGDDRDHGVDDHPHLGRHATQQGQRGDTLDDPQDADGDAEHGGEHQRRGAKIGQGDHTADDEQRAENEMTDPDPDPVALREDPQAEVDQTGDDGVDGDDRRDDVCGLAGPDKEQDADDEGDEPADPPRGADDGAGLVEFVVDGFSGHCVETSWLVVPVDPGQHTHRSAKPPLTPKTLRRCASQARRSLLGRGATAATSAGRVAPNFTGM